MTSISRANVITTKNLYIYIYKRHHMFFLGISHINDIIEITVVLHAFISI